MLTPSKPASDVLFPTMLTITPPPASLVATAFFRAALMVLGRDNANNGIMWIMGLMEIMQVAMIMMMGIMGIIWMLLVNWCYWEEKEEKYNYLKNYNPLLSTFYCSFCLDRVHGIAIENFRLLKHHKANRTSYCLVSSYLSGELASWFEIDHELITDGCEAVSFVILVPPCISPGASNEC